MLEHLLFYSFVGLLVIAFLLREWRAIGKRRKSPSESYIAELRKSRALRDANRSLR